MVVEVWVTAEIGDKMSEVSSNAAMGLRIQRAIVNTCLLYMENVEFFMNSF